VLCIYIYIYIYIFIHVVFIEFMLRCMYIIFVNPLLVYTCCGCFSLYNLLLYAFGLCM
jgi:hypothetical protein